MRKVIVILGVGFLIGYFCIVCNNPVKKKDIENDTWFVDTAVENKLLKLFLEKSNFSLDQRRRILDSLRPFIKTNDLKNYNLYLYITGVLLENSGNSDSARQFFDKMLPGAQIDSSKVADLIILKNIGQIAARSNSWVDVTMINKLQDIIRFAEKIKYKYIYEVYNVAAGTYYRYGDTVSPVKYLKLGFDNYPLTKTPLFKAYYYNRMGTALIAVKKWNVANNYLDSGYRIALQTKDTVLLASTFEKKRSIYAQAGDPEKEIYYQNQAFSIKHQAGLLTEADWSNQALNLQNQRKYSDAIKYYLRALTMAKARSNLYVIQISYAGLHANYRRLKNYETASRYLDSSYEVSTSIIEKREADKVADITLKYEEEKKDEQILQLNKQTSLQAQILGQQKTIILTLAVLMLAVIAVGIVLFRQRKLRMTNERLEAAWNKLSLELRLLRSQMEPHFLFNMLADLQGLIHMDQKEKASKFLSKFARFIRLNLENSRTEWVLLPDEIESLENYLILQQMRLENTFDFDISVYQGYTEDNILIPPMLLQPFVENSILHGFNNLSYKGHILISIQQMEVAIKCVIDDNGTGIVEERIEKKKSLSTVITRERLEALRRQTKQPASLVIVDKSKQNQQGVRVELTIPFKLSDI